MFIERTRVGVLCIQKQLSSPKFGITNTVLRQTVKARAVGFLFHEINPGGEHACSTPFTSVLLTRRVWELMGGASSSVVTLQCEMTMLF